MEKFRAIQAPLKERCGNEPEAAAVTLRASGRLGEGVTLNAAATTLASRFVMARFAPQAISISGARSVSIKPFRPGSGEAVSISIRRSLRYHKMNFRM
jgi:hypothetical protein